MGYILKTCIVSWKFQLGILSLYSDQMNPNTPKQLDNKIDIGPKKFFKL